MAPSLTEPVADLIGSEQHLRAGPSAAPVRVRLLELVLILYAFDISWSLPVYSLLFTGQPFSPEWESSWTRLFQGMYGASGLGILGYILHSNRVRQTTRLGEVCGLVLVLWTAFGFYIFHSLQLLGYGVTILDLPNTFSWFTPLSELIDQSAALAVLAYVLYRSSSSFSAIGLRWTASDAATALLLLLAGEVIRSLVYPFVGWGAQVVTGFETARLDLGPYLYGTQVLLLSVLGAILNGFFEELIVRAYLMTVIKRLTGNNLVPIVVSIGVQISYHFYQGAPSALSHIGLFSLFAIYYAKTNRILPVALAHSAFDLLSVMSHAARIDAAP